MYIIYFVKLISHLSEGAFGTLSHVNCVAFILSIIATITSENSSNETLLRCKNVFFS